jgi:hypothetical protein
MMFTKAFGGSVLQPLSVAPYVYVVAGAVITAYDYTLAGAPVMGGGTNAHPANGLITGLARNGDYLYAGWTTAGGAAGIAMCSIADRAHPKLLC